MWWPVGSGAGDGEDGDVVFLAEALGGVGDVGGGEAGEVGEAVEAEEFAFGGAGFDDAVGEEDEGLAGREGGGGRGVDLVGGEAEGRGGVGGSSWPAR